METEEEVDILMSSDIYSATLSTKSITFARAQSGWLFREDKTVSVRVPSRGLEMRVVCLRSRLIPVAIAGTGGEFPGGFLPGQRLGPGVKETERALERGGHPEEQGDHGEPQQRRKPHRAELRGELAFR